MRPSRRTPDKRIIVFPVILSVFYLSFFSCAAKIDKDDEFKSIWNVIEAKIPGWIEYCRRIDPGFDTDNFYLEKSAALKPVSEYSFTEYSPKEPDSIYSVYYYVYSPDSTRFLDIYSVSAQLSIENSAIKAWFEGDGAAVLVDLKNGKKSMYIDCGTACGFDEAVWIDNDSFIITGAIAALTPPYLSHAFVQYINLKEKVRKTYLSSRTLPRGSGPEYGYYGYKFPEFIK